MKLGEELNESLGSKKDRCSGTSQIDELKRDDCLLRVMHLASNDIFKMLVKL